MFEGKRSDEIGQSLPVIVLMFIVLCGMVGMTVDVGYGMLQKRRLQAAVDLGLLSGARDLPNATVAATDATAYVRTNFREATSQNLTVSTNTSCMVAGCASHDRLALTARTRTPTFFVKLFGIDNWNVSATGAACGPCDSSPVSYDVVVVLDRSNSMCTNASGSRNSSCPDLQNAKEGIKEFLTFFDDDTDRVSLTVLSSSDTAPCSSTSTSGNCPAGHRNYSHATTSAPGAALVTGSARNPPACDGANPNYVARSPRVNTTQNGTYFGPYYGSLGDFMDGTASQHDAWVVVPLNQGTNFKNADGTVNNSSPFVSTLDCIQGKGWTPMAPALYEATEELRLNGRMVDSTGNDVYRAIVYFGDGGGTTTPVRRTADGHVTTTNSWYTPTTGNQQRPCQDAVDQSRRAWNSFGIHVYTIGYALDEGTAQDCRANITLNSNGSWAVPNESPSITAEQTLMRMAQGDGDFYEKVGSGDVSAIFAEIGHAITAGGTRLVD